MMEKIDMVHHPVLLIAFNRPVKTQIVLEAIRLAAPTRLYVAVDGPRADRPEDFVLCGEVRELIALVDWPCEVKTLFRDENLGCGRAVSEAISWFFSEEEAGIILEDDILPTQSFFKFCDVTLEMYFNNDDVSMIAGSCFVPSDMFDGFSYKFSSYPIIWGWASWRRAWQHFDYEMRSWPAWNQSSGLERIARQDKLFENYWRNIFQSQYAGEVKSIWDYQWLFKNWELGFKTIVPRVNLVTNIGFDIDATHTVSVPWYIKKYKAENIDFPLCHPPDLAPDRNVDCYIRQRVMGFNLMNKAKHLIKKIIGDRAAYGVRYAATMFHK